MVKPGKTYLLRLINAALDDELYFTIANHTLTVVEADASYVKPFQTNIVLLGPGQTTNVLLKTKPMHPKSTFYMLARTYFTGQGIIDNTTVAGILKYQLKPMSNHFNSSKNLPVIKPFLPPINSTSYAANFTKMFRSLANSRFPANVPKTVDKKYFFTVGLGTNPCPKNQTCQGPTNTTQFAAAINNVSFILPNKTSLLQAYLSGMSKRLFSTDFPNAPVFPFNYTGLPPNNTNVSKGTKLMVLKYNTTVELVLQGTSILGIEAHPFHLHGFNFYVVGQGFGNFDPARDPKQYNLVDPVERNTINVPSGGWVAIRFLADNPGNGFFL